MTPSVLTQIALLGTERQPPPVAAPGSPVGDLLAQLDAANREQFVLSAAALAFQHERTSALAGHDSRPMPEPCRAEERRRASHRAGSSLLSLLGGERAELLSEWLQLAAQTQQVAPPETLPGLLALGANKPELREAVLPVLGQRGRWLAGQNPDWTWPVGAADDEAIWQTGEPSARLVFLQRLRRANPARARELLASTWKEEAPDDRPAFLAALASGLGAEDEPFLESALDDKRKEARRAAADLLARLPGSGLVRRMTERVTPLLQFTKAEGGSLLRLKKGKKSAVEITLPAQCDKAMQRDGVEPKPPHGIGEKAWWLAQMLEVVPLKTWTAAWNSTAAGILTASLDGEWKKELFEAWARAAIRQQEPDWADALLTAAVDMKRLDKPAALIAAMAPARREAWLTAMLSTEWPNTRELLGTLLVSCIHDWSPAFSRTVLSWLRGMTSQASTDWPLRSQLKTLAIHLAPETLAEAANGWPTDSKGWEFWSKGMDEFLAAAHFRQEMREALSRQD